jgi:hypothetical protein
MGVYRPMTVFVQCTAREDKTPALLNIGSMSPPGYTSAWLHPCSARSRSPGEAIVAPGGKD